MAVRRWLASAAAIVVLGAVSPEAWARQYDDPDVASLTLRAGMVKPMRELPDGTTFKSGPAGGLAGTIWPFRHFGVRAGAVFSMSGGAPVVGSTSRPGEDAREQWTNFYSFEVAARLPMVSGDFAWYPYVAGGVAGKQYVWSDKYRTAGIGWDMAFAWRTSVGVSLRPAGMGRYGVVVDVSRFSSKYSWHGYHWDRPTVSDLSVTAGVSMHW